jgi:small subunit ribosomal protein S1
MSDDTFASLFEAQAKDAAPRRALRVGETLEAVVAQVGRDTVFVEIDGKRQGMIDAVELRGADGELTVRVGDVVRARIVEIDGSGAVRLAKGFGKSGDLVQIQQALEMGTPVEGKVTGVNKGGLEVDLGKGLRGFCPTSQIAGRGASIDPKDFVGQTLPFQVTELTDRGVVLSRRKLLEAEARESRERVLATLEKGKLVRGVVTAVRDFGAFVDLGGVDGLIPASEISHERGVPISDRIKAGEAVEAQVLDIKDDEHGEKRITLSLKALLPAPERPAGAPQAKLAIGAVVGGRVVRIENYGVFVQVDGTEGREGRGLVPAAELGVPRGTDLRKTFPEGTVLTVKVLETGDGRLKLSVKAAKEAAERSDFEAHRDKTSPKGFGTFGDLLKGKLGKK